MIFFSSIHHHQEVPYLQKKNLKLPLSAFATIKMVTCIAVHRSLHFLNSEHAFPAHDFPHKVFLLGCISTLYHRPPSFSLRYNCKTYMVSRRHITKIKTVNEATKVEHLSSWFCIKTTRNTQLCHTVSTDSSCFNH